MRIERARDLLIDIFEWTIKDLIRATEITSDELDEMGYEKESFRDMHDFADNLSNDKRRV